MSGCHEGQPSLKREASLRGAHETIRSGGRIFEQSENTQGIALRKREPFGLGFRQRRAENVAGQIKTLDRRGAGQRRLVFGPEPQFDAAVGRPVAIGRDVSVSYRVEYAIDLRELLQQARETSPR